MAISQPIELQLDKAKNQKNKHIFPFKVLMVFPFLAYWLICGLYVILIALSFMLSIVNEGLSFGLTTGTARNLIFVANFIRIKLRTRLNYQLILRKVLFGHAEKGIQIIFPYFNLFLISYEPQMIVEHKTGVVGYLW